MEGGQGPFATADSEKGLLITSSGGAGEARLRSKVRDAPDLLGVTGFCAVDTSPTLR